MSRTAVSIDVGATRGMSLHDSVVRQFNLVADLLELDVDVRRILTQTTNEITVNFPVKTEGGQIEMFTGYRVQHNNVLGPFNGGVRFHPSVSVDTVRALAKGMTWKAALTRVPFGGASGGVRFDPSGYTRSDLERITRRFTFALEGNIGPDYDILTTDVNANAQIMAWILDTYLSTIPGHDRNRWTHVVTGKPARLGGIRDHRVAVAQGIVFLIETWARDHGIPLNHASYVIQGFGNVGSSVSLLLKDRGARLLAVEDSSGALHNPRGIDPTDLIAYVRENGSQLGYPKAEAIDHDTFLSTKAEVFIPAALGNQITSATAPLLNVRLVAEGANGPTDPEGDLVLREREIDVIPDILCNSGSVIVSYFEWLQNKRSELWDPEELTEKLRARMSYAYARVRQAALEHRTDFRTGAYIVALKRLEKVYKERGIFP